MEWEKTVAAAEKENQLTIYIFDAGPVTAETVQAFEKSYPKIKVNQLRARGSDLGPRIIAERRAGKYLVDVFTGGKGTAHATLYIGKTLEPIKPLLILPEVLDETKWWQGRHKYVDPEAKYIFVFVGNGGGVNIGSTRSTSAAGCSECASAFWFTTTAARWRRPLKTIGV